MKPLFTLSTLILMLFCLKVCAQNKLTLDYDQNGKGLDSKKKAAYYRVLELNDSNKTIGIDSDFYMSGTLLKIGNASYIDKIDDSKTLWIGQVLSFDEDGRLSAYNNYDAVGNLGSVQTVFNIEGNTETSEYLHGNPAKDYFLVTDRQGIATKYSFLTHLPIKPSIHNDVIVPVTLRKMIYQDGQVVQFYNIGGMSVAAKYLQNNCMAIIMRHILPLKMAPNRNLILTRQLLQHH